MSERANRNRTVILAMLLITAWAALTIRLCCLHLGPNTRLKDRITQIRTKQETIPPARGRIFDASGSVMAMDLAVNNVIIDPSAISATNGMAERVATILSSALHVEPAVIWQKLQWSNKYAVIRKNVPIDIADSIKTARLVGVHLENVSRRYYPRGSLACHVIGFTAATSNTADIVGQAGIERRMDKYLRGIPGLLVSEVDGRHRELLLNRTVEMQAKPGHDVYLTIDQYLQYVVEQSLQLAIDRNMAKGAWAILQRVKTGEIIAMASMPCYNLNDLNKSNETNRRNNAISYNYEPGSTFKMATIAAALDAGTVSPREIIDCEKGVWIYAGKPLRDFHPHGALSVGDVLKVSSNIGAAKVALTLGVKRLHDYLYEFGVGVKSGISLWGEESGLLHQTSRWNGLSITRVPMGHEVMVTSLQILGIINAIGNDGLLIKPQIVNKIVTTSGNAIYQRRIEVLSRPIKPETAQLMRKLLTRTTEKGGTASKACFEGFTVAGKTGTAQKVLPGGGYSDTANIASFVGIVPAEKPELALIVVVDEPGIAGQHTGGAVCAPVFREIMEQAVRYLDIPPVSPSLAWHFGDEVPDK